MGPEGNSLSENARKRSLVNPTNERSVNDGSSLPAEVVHPNVPASLLPGEQLSSLPLPTLEPLEASGATAASLAVGDQEVSASVSVSLTNCGLCQVSIDQPKVRCTTCDKFFHDDIMCTGLDDQEISALIGNTNGALLYKCCHCRLGGGEDSAGQLQLIRIVGGLVKAIKFASGRPKSADRTDTQSEVN